MFLCCIFTKQDGLFVSQSAGTGAIQGCARVLTDECPVNKGNVCFVWFVDTDPVAVQDFQVRLFHLALQTFNNIVSTRFDLSNETIFVLKLMFFEVTVDPCGV